MPKFFGGKRVLLVVLVLVSASFLSGAGMARRVLARGDDYENLRVFTEVLSLVQSNYVEDIENNERVTSGSAGLRNTSWGYEWYLLHEGKWSELQHLIDERALPTLAVFRNTALCARARLAWYQGRLDDAWDLIDSMLPNGPDRGSDDSMFFLQREPHRIAAGLALDAGDLTLAREWLESHDAWLDWSGAVLGCADGLLLWAKIHHAEGDDDMAARFACDALGCASQPGQPIVQIAIHRFLGDVGRKRGELDTAETQIRTSLKLAEACDLPYERALTLLASAQLELAKGNREEAVDLLEEVRRVGTELGARPILEHAETLAAGLTTPRKTDARYGLSSRELEVLQLLVEGRSNKEIGDDLYISPRTVMQHVSSILRKLDVENRSAVAARAIRENLI
jgi:ATP/maltotriose-dependent transcriptional regulator MalT